MFLIDSISRTPHMFGVSRSVVFSGSDLYSSMIFPTPPDPLWARRVSPSFLSFGARVVWICSIFLSEFKMMTVWPFSFLTNFSMNFTVSSMFVFAKAGMSSARKI